MSRKRGGIDKRNRLTSDPFDFAVTKDGRVQITRSSRIVSTLGGAAAAKLVTKLERAAGKEREIQLLLAKASGHYKH